MPSEITVKKNEKINSKSVGEGQNGGSEDLCGQRKTRSVGRGWRREGGDDRSTAAMQ